MFNVNGNRYGHFIGVPQKWVVYVTKVVLNIFVSNQDLQISIFTVYETPDMQSTNVKHKSSVAHICHEKSITTLWIQMCIFSSFTLLYFMSQVVTQMHGTVSCTHWFMYRFLLNTLRPRQNGRRFADDTFKRIVLNENIRISIKISLKFVPKDPINNNPALVQIMACCRSGDKPLSESLMVSLLTHICGLSEFICLIFLYFFVFIFHRKSITLPFH